MGWITSGSFTDSLRLNAATFHYRYCLTSFTNPSTELGRRSIADRKNRGRREQVRTILDSITTSQSRHFYGLDYLQASTLRHITNMTSRLIGKYRKIDGF